MFTGKDYQMVSQLISENYPQILTSVLENIYRDPIYLMHFGAAWDQLIQEDVQADLDNLVLAIQFDLKDSPEKHYRHMQSILINRGRCTRIICETILALRTNIQALVQDQWEVAAPFFESALEGISYSDLGSKVLSGMADLISQGSLEMLASRFPDASSDKAWMQERKRELELSISYLADSLETKTPQYFWSFVDWIAEYHTKTAQPGKVIDQELNSLSKVITRQLEPVIARRLRPIIYQVRRSI